VIVQAAVEVVLVRVVAPLHLRLHDLIVSL
jgi:hypothetical protein